MKLTSTFLSSALQLMHRGRGPLHKFQPPSGIWALLCHGGALLGLKWEQSTFLGLGSLKLKEFILFCDPDLEWVWLASVSGF